jgi:hypothetical protein
MQDRHALSEELARPAPERRNQGDLGHEEQDGALLCQTGLRRTQENFGLARAGGSLK